MFRNLSSTTNTLSSSARSQGHSSAGRSTIVPWAHVTNGQTNGIGQSRFFLPCDRTETIHHVCQTEFLSQKSVNLTYCCCKALVAIWFRTLLYTYSQKVWAETSVLFESSRGFNFLTTDDHKNCASLAGHKNR